MEQVLKCNNWDLSSVKVVSSKIERYVQDGAHVFKNQVIGSWTYSFDEGDGFGMEDSELLISNSFGKISWVNSSEVKEGSIFSYIFGPVNLDINFVSDIYRKWLDYRDAHRDEVTSPTYYPISSLPFDQGLLFYVIGNIYKNIAKAKPTYSEDPAIALMIGQVLKFCVYLEHEPHETKMTRLSQIFGGNGDPSNMTAKMMYELRLLSKDATLKANDEYYSKFIIDGLKSFSEYSGYPLNNLYRYNALLLGQNSPLPR